MSDIINGLKEILNGDKSVDVSVSLNTTSVLKACAIVLGMSIVFLAVKKLV